MVDEKAYEQKVAEYARILLEGEPDHSEDWEGWCRWRDAVDYFDNLLNSLRMMRMIWKLLDNAL